MRIPLTSEISMAVQFLLFIQMGFSVSMLNFGLLTQGVFLTSRTTAFYSPLKFPFPPSFLNLRADSTALIIASSTVTLRLQQSRKTMKYNLSNVLHVPKLCYQLLSVPAMTKLGINAHSAGNETLCFVNRIPHCWLLEKYLADRRL